MSIFKNVALGLAAVLMMTVSSIAGAEQDGIAPTMEAANSASQGTLGTDRGGGPDGGDSDGGDAHGGVSTILNWLMGLKD